MRTLKALAVAVAAAAVLPASAMAQDTTPTTPKMSPESTSPESPSAMQNTTAQPTVLTAQEDGQVLSNNYIGADVVARGNEGVESVGKVSQLVLGPDDKIVGVVVDVGGFLGVGAKPVGLAWSGLTEEMSEGAVMLKTSLTRAELEEAPEFKTLEAQQVESDQQMMEQQAPTGTTTPQ